MPVRKTKRTAAADTDADRRADDLAAAADAEAATVVESVEAAADVTRAEDEAATAATFSALSEAAAEARYARCRPGGGDLLDGRRGGRRRGDHGGPQQRRVSSRHGACGHCRPSPGRGGPARERRAANARGVSSAARATSCAASQSARSAGRPRVPSSPTGGSTSPAGSRPWDSARCTRARTNTRRQRRLARRAPR